MAMHRSALKRRRRSDAADTKSRNAIVKSKERMRRDARMLATLRGGELPFAPHVMSWLSRKLEKRATKITTEDVNALVA